jgi:hypothetical protein
LKYPSLFPTENILISVDDYKNPSEITTMRGDIGYALLVSPKNDTQDIKPYVEKRFEQELAFENVTIFEPVHKVTYANTTGYEFTTNENTENMATVIFLDNGKQIFQFLSVDKITNFDLDKFKQSVNSLKFLDR